MLWVAVATLPNWLSGQNNNSPEWLFRLRGVRAPPPQVLVVSIDRESSRYFNLPNIPRHWPRSLHAQLITQLKQRGAQVVAFDVLFQEPRAPEQDQALEQALAAAGNVVLFERLDRDWVVHGNLRLESEQRVPPLARFATHSAALAPFPLPKMPEPVRQFWLFKEGADNTPTLPVMAVYVYLRPYYPLLLERLAAHQLQPPDLASLYQPGGAVTLARWMYQLQQQQPQLLRQIQQQLARDQQLSHEQQHALQVLFNLHNSGNSRYLDFYGPPRTIRTLPYYQALSTSVDLHGAIVFVGFSENFQPQQQDGFVTVYSQQDGVDLAGVEIAATAAANLLEQRQLYVFSGGSLWALLLGWAGLIGWSVRRLSPRWMIPFSLVLASAYIGLAYGLFVHLALVLPVGALVTLPLLLGLGLLQRYRGLHRLQQRMLNVLKHYLAPEVIEVLEAGGTHAAIPAKEQFCVCVSTDVQGYTRFAEGLAPLELQRQLNRYFAALSPAVVNNGGRVSDIVGDSMLAVWTSEQLSPAQLCQQACQAAWEIVVAAEQGEVPLKTRVGVYSGMATLGSVGGEGHYEYRVVGDVVNTSTRLQELNKRLGTQVLLVREIAQYLPTFTCRALGYFRLPGKQQAAEVLELCAVTNANAAEQTRLQLFDSALRAFQQGQWGVTLGLLQIYQQTYGADQASEFYRQWAEQYQQQPPLQWDGALELQKQ